MMHMHNKGHILARLGILGPPLDGLDPFSINTLLNWPTGPIKISWTAWILRDSGMPKSFAKLLTPKIVIVNTKTLENEQIMTQKTKKSSSGGQHSELRTP